MNSPNYSWQLVKIGQSETMKVFKIICNCPQMQVLVILSARKTYLSDFNTQGNLQTKITNTVFCEQQNNWTPRMAARILTILESMKGKIYC